MDCTLIGQKTEEEVEKEKKKADFANLWNQELTFDERIALLSKTFDNKS
jgi:hypothetical protein